MVLFNLGEKFSKEKYEKEISEILKKIDSCKSNGDNIGTSWNYQMAARLAEEFGDLKASIDYILQSIEFSLKDNRFFNVGWLYKIAAGLEERNKNLNSASGFAAKSAEYFLKANSQYAALWSYTLAGKLSEENKDYYSALKYYKKANQIEPDREIEEHMEELKKKVPHPLIDVHADKSEIEEGEEVEFTVSVENNSREYLKNIKLIGESGIEEIRLLKPKEKKLFVYKTTGKVGVLRPKYKKVAWDDPSGKPIEKTFLYFGVRVKPKVEVKAAVNPPLRLNKKSDFVILLKNLSSSSLRKIKCFVDFPSDLIAKKEWENKVEAIKPGDEKGIVFSLVPRTVGKTTLDKVLIEYTDDYGIEYQVKVPPIVLEEALETKNVSQSIQRKIDEKRKHLDFEPNPMLEEDYIKKTEGCFTKEKGYSLDKITIEDVSEHVLEECSSMTLVGSHEQKDERLFLFSGTRDGQTYLLTAALKVDRGFVNVLFKIYSEKERGLEDVLEKISDAVEYTASVVSSAIKVEKVEVNEVINIIDSIVQRSKIGQDTVKDKQVTVKDSVIRKTEL